MMSTTTWCDNVGGMSEPPTPQPDKFRDLARQLECDEEEATFEDQVRRIAKSPKPEGKPDEQ